MAQHELKTWPEFFDAVARGEKTFEVRLNDRGYQRGDVLVLLRWEPKTETFSQWSKPLRRRVTYVLSGMGIEPGFVVMGLEDEPGEMDENAACREREEGGR